MITLITCTGERPEALDLLVEWIAAQDYGLPFEWIIVDDCLPATADAAAIAARAPLAAVKVIRPERPWSKAVGNTMNRNLVLALAVASGEKILFIEDDECYLPSYVSTMDTLLNQADLAGLIPARYYHVGMRRYRELPNHSHASLCQTGMRRNLMTRMVHLSARPDPFIDLHLWQSSGTLVPEPIVVSLKGMPGRAGLGAGHRVAMRWPEDPELEMLARWAGPERASRYARFYLK